MATQTFKNYLEKNNLDIKVIETTQPTRTAQEAADTHGVPVSNIVKSLLVKVDEEFKLFLVPGDKRLDLEDLKKRFNTENIRMATADEVKEVTGFSIGGVPPFGHTNPIPTYIEEGFDENKAIAAAAGSGNSVFKTTLSNLKTCVHQD